MSADQRAVLRVQHYYRELLADFHRRQAGIAADYAATLHAWRRDQATRQGPTPEPPSPASFDEDDFSHNTWLR